MSIKKKQYKDPLVDCLRIICQIEKQHFSEQSVLAGLPLQNEPLTPKLFPEAAKRVGFNTKFVKRSLNKISHLVLPVILILKNNRACILKRIDRKKAEIICSEDKPSVKKVLIKDLQKEFTGYSIFLHHELKIENRAKQFHTDNSRSWFWGTVFQYKNIYSHVLVAAILTNLFVLASPLFVMNVYDRVVPNFALETLWVLASITVVLFLFDFMSRMLRSYLIDIAGKKSDIVLAAKMFQQTLGLRMKDKPISSGAFSNYFYEFETLRDFFTSATLLAVIDMPFILLFLSATWFIGGNIVVIPLIAIPIIIFVAVLLELPTRTAVQKALAGASQKQAILIETIMGLEAIKTLVAESAMQKKWEYYVSNTAKHSMHSRFYSSLASNFTIWMQQLVTIGVVIYGVYLIQLGELSVGGLIACTILSGRSVMLGQVVNLLNRFERSREALHGLNNIMSLPTERSAKKNFLHRPNLSGEIIFDNVSFSYPEQQISSLENVSLTIKAGERVGIIGKIGSGKSTLLKQIIGLYTPTSGAVLMDGTHNTEIEPSELRQQISYVAHDSVLFYGSVYENIAMGASTVTDQQVLQAANIAGVSRFVKRHPAGFDMLIGEHGERISGGQRQAIALARALVSHPTILLLDEPTATMDSGTERQFMDSIPEYLTGKTLLLVSHRAALLGLVDRVLIIEEGRIVADGPTNQILMKLASLAK